MNKFKKLALFGFVVLTLTVPFVRTAHISAMSIMDHSQIPSMPAAISDCVSACIASNSLPLDLIKLDQGMKQKEREPSPPPVEYWRMFNAVPLEDLYVLLPIVFLLLLYKDPKRRSAIPLRF